MSEQSDNRAKARATIPALLREAGGLRPGVATEIAKKTNIAEAQIYGVGSFFHLLADYDHDLRVCQGLSCALAGAENVLDAAKAAGLAATGCSCLAECDRPVAVLHERAVRPAVTAARIGAPETQRGETTIGAYSDDPERLVNALSQPPDYGATAYQRAQQLGANKVIELISESGLQGRGGAGFPAGIKWRAVADQAETQRYVVLNADEGEPGTFKDREVLVRRPDTVIEGLAIAASAVGAKEIYCYLRGEFDRPWAALTDAIDQATKRNLYPGLHFHLHEGHGAYICGEETAMLEAIEGKRGMPRLKPPYPTDAGLWGKPTLVHNVETISCVPAIIARAEQGAQWFKGLGRSGAGTKLYCLSGHVARPGVYEMPLGICLDELVEAAGGYRGTLKAFSPGGASSGFLPASERQRPLDFGALAEVGSMLGSAGVVVLNDSVDMLWAARQQLLFFEEESCGQCAPCRIGTRFVGEAIDRAISARKEGDPAATETALAQIDDVAWQMVEGSICGLGQTAALPLTSVLKWFTEEVRG